MPDDGVEHSPAEERAAAPGLEPTPPEGARPKRRRATTPPPPGSDPSPLPEPPRGTGTENDDRLKADKPPHY